MEGQRDERSSWFPKALPKTGKILDPGCYRATLKGIFPGKSKGFDGSGERLTLMFSFQIEGSGEVINRTVNASNADKSQCLQLVRNNLLPMRLLILRGSKNLSRHCAGLLTCCKSSLRLMGDTTTYSLHFQNQVNECCRGFIIISVTSSDS